MTVGVLMLVHQNLDRAAEVARHWAQNGCPVVIHLDSKVRSGAKEFMEMLVKVPGITFCARRNCEWGTWSIVHATQLAGEMMLEQAPEVEHVYLTSEACLPLRAPSELIDYLSDHPETDYIESVTTEDVPWTIGGLDYERFSLRFPFSWKRRRRLFDRYVRLQRRIGFKRSIPQGVEPHLGSQWWCLTRKTLVAILTDPNRPIYDRYFRRVWIPDEAYFQTLVRQHSENIESRSLTLSKFDYQGKPHVFYDDHLQLLRRSDCFVARKIWPQAERLYQTFLTSTPGGKVAEPQPDKIDRVFSKATEQRVEGRPGLYMQSRFPNKRAETASTAGPYSVLQGFSDLLVDFETWFASVTGSRVHGHLYAQHGAEFHDGASVFSGGLSNSAALRDYNPKSFVCNLVWNTRGARQSFMFGPDDQQAVTKVLAADRNAHISVVAGAWAVPLYRSEMAFPEKRKIAAHLQRVEYRFLQLLRTPEIRARVHIWPMAEFLDRRRDALRTIVETTGGPFAGQSLTDIPPLVDLSGFGGFLQKLKNRGMHLHLAGNFPAELQVQHQLQSKMEGTD